MTEQNTAPNDGSGTNINPDEGGGEGADPVTALTERLAAIETGLGERDAIIGDLRTELNVARQALHGAGEQMQQFLHQVTQTGIPGGGSLDEDDDMDPTVAALKQEIAELKQGFSQTQEQLQADRTVTTRERLQSDVQGLVSGLDEHESVFITDVDVLGRFVASGGRIPPADIVKALKNEKKDAIAKLKRADAMSTAPHMRGNQGSPTPVTPKRGDNLNDALAAAGASLLDKAMARQREKHNLGG